VMLFCKLKPRCSHAPGVAPQDGYAMCDVRRLRNFPRSCRQGERGKDPFYFTYLRFLFVKFDFFFFFFLFSRSFHTILRLVPSSPNNRYVKKKGVKFSPSCPLSRSHVAVSLIVTSAYSSPLLAINERTKAPVSLSSRLGWRQPRSEWFRVYRVRIRTPTSENEPHY
jgi:hypothetical protein